jgi:hypothetical protein
VKRERAEDRARDGARAADHGDEQHLDAALRPEGDDRVDIEVGLRVEDAAEGRDGARDREGRDLGAQHLDAERARRLLVLAHRDQLRAEAAASDPDRDHDRECEERECERIEDAAIRELEVRWLDPERHEDAEPAPCVVDGVGEDAEGFRDRQRREREIAAAQPRPEGGPADEGADEAAGQRPGREPEPRV